MHTASVSSWNYLNRVCHNYYYLWLWISSHRRKSSLHESHYNARTYWIWRLRNLSLVYLHHNDLYRLWVVLTNHYLGKISGSYHVYIWSCYQLLYCCCSIWISQNENWINSFTYNSLKAKWGEKIIWRVCWSACRNYISDSTPFWAQIRSFVVA